MRIRIIIILLVLFGINKVTSNPVSLSDPSNYRKMNSLFLFYLKSSTFPKYLPLHKEFWALL